MTTFVALDFETADNGRDSACSVGLIRVENYQIVQRVHHLIRPPRSTFRFTSIHGVAWCHVADQPSFGELWKSISPILQGAEFLAAHNAPFDKGVLYACCDAYEISRPPQPFICTVQLARRTWDIRPTRLPNVCEYLGIQLDHHQALSDAEACARIVIAAQGYSSNGSSKTIIECPTCNGKLRVSTGQTGTIICPRCKHEFTTST
ncbi:3'-5' exonuclease [Leptolyngbya sp. FACHB-541]|uniref:3'-5' exonuclease n=1 Tax=Leptolyngbya sp. FACHB-541 TaxID=2692810 RepID=UPI001687012D|nr:3'-5' exonuclease [Leptolyngbya sp. FACHB-541]MBD1999319.1 3'-5' exonuclease [Leptolyngbya sp. FACHB-541]